MSKHRRRKFWVILLLGGLLTNASAGDYLLVSCMEYGVRPSPCVIYNLDSENGTLEKKFKIPPSNVHHLHAIPERREIVILSFSGKDSSHISLVPVDNPDKMQSMSIPFYTSTVYYLGSKDSDSSLLVRGQRSKNYEMTYYSLEDTTTRTLNFFETPWMDIPLRGSSYQRTLHTQHFSLFLNQEPLTLSVGAVEQKIPLELSMDGALKSHLRKLEIRGVVAVCNDTRSFVIRINPPLKHGANTTFFVYDKEKKDWTRINGKGERSSIKMFNKWFVVQEVKYSPDITMLGPATGMFSFYRRNSSKKMIWKTDPDTELIGIWGDELLFRTRDQIFSARIENNHVVDEKRLCKSPALKQVHWAFPVK